jgi:hypothetical protein
MNGDINNNVGETNGYMHRASKNRSEVSRIVLVHVGNIPRRLGDIVD